MDPAIKSGFAIGFVVVAAAGGFFAWRDHGLRLPERLGAPPPAGLSPKAPETGDSRAGRQDAPRADPSPAAPPAPPAQANAEPPKAPGAAATQPKAAPAPDTKAAKGEFDVVRVEPSGEMVVAGRCAANCAVELTANGKPHDAAVADAQGNFAMAPPPLPPGDYQLGLKVKGPDGREIVSEQTVTVSVPKPPMKDVVVVLNDPNAPSRILQKPEPEAQGPKPADVVARRSPAPPAKPEPKLSVGAVDAENGRFFVQGAAPAGAKLRIYLNDALVAEPVAGPDGRWSLKVEKGLASGSYAMRVDQIGQGGGKVLARAEVKFGYEGEVLAVAPKGGGAAAATVAKTDAEREAEPKLPASAAAEPRRPAADGGATPPETASPHAPEGEAAVVPPPPAAAGDAANPVVAAIGAVKVKRGDSLWRISRGLYGQGRRYTILFAANDGQIRDPDLIYPNQVLVAPAEQAGASDAAARR